MLTNGYHVHSYSVHGTGVSHVYLEKVGQYLREEDLLQPPDRGNNPWVKLLESTPELAETPFIIPVTSKTSLIKEHSLLVSSVTDIFSALARDLTPESQLLSQFQLVSGADMDSVRQHTDETISQADWRTDFFRTFWNRRLSKNYTRSGI